MASQTIDPIVACFPDSPRVVYRKNPLAEVICQVRFPSILKIDWERPVQFQEKVRAEYPLFEENVVEQVAVSPDLAKLVGVPPQPAIRVGSGAAYDFLSADKVWKIGLTSTFLSLSCSQYERWESFRDRMTRAVYIFQNEYAPAFYTRTGLRYRDVIRRSQLGLTEAEWPALLQPHILGELAVKEVAQYVREAQRLLLLSLGRSASVRILHGLAKANSGETCYLIDSDFFTEDQKEAANVADILDYFNRQAGKLFRWCITDRLHEAMEPQPLR